MRGVLIYDTSTGELVVDLDIEGGAYAAQLSNSGELLAIIVAAGAVEVHDYEAVLAGEPSLVGRSASGRENQLLRPYFSDDERTLYTTENITENANAWSVGEEMTRLWSIPSAVGLVQERDGLIWLPAVGALPLDEHPGYAGFIGIPPTRSGYADFARSKATRGFTEQECEAFFDRSCAEFEALIDDGTAD